MDAYDVLGGPVLRTQLPATPAAGAEWSLTVPGRTALQILAVRAILTTGAAATARVATLRITDGNNVLASIRTPASQAATLTTEHTWMPELPTIGLSGNAAYSTGIPNRLILPPGYTIGSNTSNLDAADTWTGITVWTKEIPAYGAGAEIETSLYRAAQHLLDLAQVLGVDLSSAGA